MSILKKFKDLERILEQVHDFESANDETFFDGVTEEIREWFCDAVGGHDWCFDMCGYWQHQLCCRCNAAKYPDLASKTCSVLREEMGAMTEGEFLDNVENKYEEKLKND